MTHTDITTLKTTLADNVSEEGVCCLCYDLDASGGVYRKLRRKPSKAEAIGQLVRYAEATVQLDVLTKLAQPMTEIDLDYLQAKVASLLAPQGAQDQLAAQTIHRPETVVRLIEDIVQFALNRLRADPAVAVIVDEYQKSPEVYQGPIAQKLGDALQQDSAFATGLWQRLERYEAAIAKAEGGKPTYHAEITGSGAIAQGEGATAISATGSGIAIGSVGGSVIIGKKDETDD